MQHHNSCCDFMHTLSILFLFFINNLAVAENTIPFKLGALEIIKTPSDPDTFDICDEKGAVLKTKSGQNIIFEACGGKAYYDKLSINEEGIAYIDNQIIDVQMGKILYVDANPNMVILSAHSRLLPNNKKHLITLFYQDYSCDIPLSYFHLDPELENVTSNLKYRLKFVDTSKKIVVLATILNTKITGEDREYRVLTLNPKNCQLISDISLGNPDYLIELGWTYKGHFWITGSIEQTLLRSLDGKIWKPVTLPKDLSGLVSAYIVDNNDIWLAGIIPSGLSETQAYLVNTQDGGKTWISVTPNHALIKKIPLFWLEGQFRKYESDLQ